MMKFFIGQSFVVFDPSPYSHPRFSCLKGISLTLVVSLQVVVHVTDENDCTPEFMHSIYSRDNIPETTMPGTSLLQGEWITWGNLQLPSQLTSSKIFFSFLNFLFVSTQVLSHFFEFVEFPVDCQLEERSKHSVVLFHPQWTLIACLYTHVCPAV